MEIRISKESDVPLRQQVAEQIIGLIATEKLKPGEALPSVRELARRLKIHHNTISRAYQDLVERHWAVSRRGSRLVVIRESKELPRTVRDQGLDDLLNLTIEMARLKGYSLQDLRDQVRKRLLTQPPDHILVVEEEPGLLQLMMEEIKEAIRWPVEGCSRKELAQNPGLLIGAQVVTPQYAVGDTEAMVPRDHPAIPVAFNPADELLGMVRRLRDPSVIAVVSISQVLLQAAQGNFAPALGGRHTLSQYVLPLEHPGVLSCADVIICDSVALREMKNSKCTHYRMCAPASLDYLSNAMQSFQAAKRSSSDGERIRNLFGVYLSAEVSRAILEGGTELEGKGLEVSILFCDIRDFTRFSATRTPQQSVERLNSFFSQMAGAITAQGGSINKFLGDGLMAVFGAPMPQPDHARRAVQAALQMEAELPEFNSRLRANAEPELEFSIGIDSGEVIAGNVGAKDRMEYTVIGDPVNRSSRIEQLNKTLGTRILVSERTYRSSGVARGRALPPVAVKGIEEPVRVMTVGAKA